MQHKITIKQENLPTPKFFEAEANIAKEIAQEAIQRGAMQNPAELTFFLTCVIQQRPNYNVLEIGSSAGGTFSALCAVTEQDGTLVSVDLPGGPNGGEKVPKLGTLKRYLFGTQKIFTIQANSHSPTVKEQVKLCFKSPLDVLFIDGDPEGILQDLEMYEPLVGKKRIIGIANICKHKEEWEKIKKKYPKNRKIIDHSDSTQGIGLVYKD